MVCCNQGPRQPPKPHQPMRPECHHRPIEPPTNKIVGRVNYGVSHHFEASIAFYKYREDFPAAGNPEMLYVAEDESVIYSFDPDTLKYKSVGIGRLDSETLDELLGDEYIKAEDLVETTNEEVDEFCVLPQESATEND